jgi:hypothetical protein
MLRWATDKAGSPDDTEAAVGLGTLDALDDSKPALLQPEDQGIIDAVLAALTAEPGTELGSYSDDSGEVGVGD